MAEPPERWPMTVRGEVWPGRRRGCYASLHRQHTRGSDVTERAWGARGKARADDTRAREGRRRLATPRQAEGGAVGRAQARRWRHQAGGGQRPIGANLS
jgi:hypothetical protein